MTVLNTNDDDKSVGNTMKYEDDEILFGSMNEELADSLADRIKDAIKEGIQALPLLSDPDKSKYLEDTIQEKYMRSVDVIETYGSRNIFTIRQHPPRRRQKILEAFQQSDHDDADDDKENETPAQNSNAKQTPPITPVPKSSFQYPSKDEIPSVDAMKEMEDELRTLRDDLEKAKIQHRDLLIQKKSIDSARLVSSDAVGALEKVNGVQESVTVAIMGGQGIQDLAERGKEIITQLDDSKKTRRDECYEGDSDFYTSCTTAAKKKKLSLEDQYSEDRQQVVTSMDSLAMVIGRLKKK